MATLTKYSSVKRFGPRYGRRLKEKLGAIEALKSKGSTCPQCRKSRLRRIASGIWSCKRCNVKMAGGAYTLERLILDKAEARHQNG
ncbi:50S ribosomal protein L37ae [Candidatus Woesearchaeota archaeon]|nr:50S ribosomal protein L37ae [Candidatus Woesearchaeota archaeon]